MTKLPYFVVIYGKGKCELKCSGSRSVSNFEKTLGDRKNVENFYRAHNRSVITDPRAGREAGENYVASCYVCKIFKNDE